LKREPFLHLTNFSPQSKTKQKKIFLPKKIKNIFTEENIILTEEKVISSQLAFAS
jgi:hypothetical protein